MIKKILKVISVSAFVLVGGPKMNEMGKSSSYYPCRDIKTTCETYTEGPSHIKLATLCGYLFEKGSPFFPGLRWTQDYCQTLTDDKENKKRCALITNYSRDHKECI